MNKKELLKKKIEHYLEIPEYDGLRMLSGAEPGAVRTLISLTYEMENVLSWRAMDAVGRLCSFMPADKVRTIIQRVLWMMREESGTNPWSAGMILGEIVTRSPAPFADIARIVVSFHDEPMLRLGALWSVYRIGSVRPDYMRDFIHIPKQYINAADPVIRGHALLALGAFRDPDSRELLQSRRKDPDTFRFFDGRDLVLRTVGDVAMEAVEKLRQRKAG